MKTIIHNILIESLYFFFFLSLKNKNKKFNDRLSQKILSLNNQKVLAELEKKQVKKIMILLPHCIQKFDCVYRVTNDILNCISCGGCVVKDFVDLKKKYDLEIKIATGGTLARKYIKELRPELIIAVACKNDLMTGIRDARPLKVYGIFNKILNEPCINTTVDMREIKAIISKLIDGRR